jgi:hypothetical protein
MIHEIALGALFLAMVLAPAVIAMRISKGEEKSL